MWAPASAFAAAGCSWGAGAACAAASVEAANTTAVQKTLIHRDEAMRCKSRTPIEAGLLGSQTAEAYCQADILDNIPARLRFSGPVFLLLTCCCAIQYHLKTGCIGSMSYPEDLFSWRLDAYRLQAHIHTGENGSTLRHVE